MSHAGPLSHAGPRRSRKSSQTHGNLQSRFIGSQSPLKTEGRAQMGLRNCSGMGVSSSGSPQRLRGSLFSAGGKKSSEKLSQGTEEPAILVRYHHFHGHSGICA